MENTQQTSKTPKLKLDFKDSKYATGRRKTSIAKIWLKKGTGKIYVNGKLFNEYFASDAHKMQITRPFEIINQATEYDVRCSVRGGGATGQAVGTGSFWKEMTAWVAENKSDKAVLDAIEKSWPKS